MGGGGLRRGAVEIHNQCLRGFLEREGLWPSVEDGLRDVAPEFGRGGDEFLAAAATVLSAWKVRPSNAVTRFGSVTPKTRTMRLTALDCSPDAWKDTILHEVAHVLTGELVAARENHGPRWQKIAKALGARPERAGRDARFRAAAEALREERLKVVARCDRCRFEVKRMRRSQRNWRRYLHRQCGGRFRSVES
jgi:predicted SprT family Zn-dependent metalloprotease